VKENLSYKELALLVETLKNTTEGVNTNIEWERGVYIINKRGLIFSVVLGGIENELKSEIEKWEGSGVYKKALA
jgi:hypothetical protein